MNQHVLLGSLVLLAIACGGNTSSSGASSGSPPVGTAARSSACQQWQHAYCDYISDRCKMLGRADCDETIGSLFCRDDATIQACTNALPASSCAETPAACRGVADTGPAMAFCTRFLDRACAKGEQCNQGSKAACLASSGIDCSKAVGVSPSGDTCVSDLDGAPCATPFALPPSCKGVLKLSGSAGAGGSSGAAGSSGSAGTGGTGVAGGPRLSPAAGVVRAHVADLAE